MDNIGEILIYQNQEGNIKIDVRLEEETVWLTQEQMALLFGKAKSTINEHILNIYSENELVEETSIRKIGISDFSTKPTNHYNLDVIMYMKDWIDRLDSILQLNGRELLTHAGKISHDKALEKSSTEYEKFKITQKQQKKSKILKK